MLNTIFLLAAVIGGTVMVCQFLMMFLGMGDDGSGDIGADADLSMDVDGIDGVDGPDADHHTSWSHAADADVGHPDASRIFEILSFRSVVAAVAFFGFAGKASLASELSDPQALLIGLAAGGAAMYGIYWVMLQIYRLRTSGNEDINNAIGQPARVNVAIPKQGAGAGKVQLVLQNRTVEYEAVTSAETPFKSGDQVFVVDILGPDKVLVESSAELADTHV
jgi:hypothetical protein